MSTPELIYLLQDIKLDDHYHPGHDGQNKLVYEARIVTEIKKELLRRQDMPAASTPNISIINAIKERANIEEIVSQFTAVHAERGQRSYTCPLHPDEHPSGKLYTDQNKAWCHQCNKGGDVLDIIGLFAHTDLSGAITWACKFYGISSDILPSQKRKGGVNL
jgi:hypothetical protein